MARARTLDPGKRAVVSRATPDLAGLNADPDEFVAAVLEAVTQPVWVVDHAGVIRFVNAAAVTALGSEHAEELVGRPSHETIHSRHPEASYVSVPLQLRDGLGAVVAFNDIEHRRVLREHDAALAAQEASLRRVATLVAAGAASGDVFAAVAEEVGRVTSVPLVSLWRYEPDGTTATVVGSWAEGRHPFQAGTRWPLDGPAICTQVLETGAPARIDDFAALPGTIAKATREMGIYACAGAPILVDGDVWGAISADSTNREPLPDDIEDRLAEFTELVAAAISTTASRAELARLADEQAALRRVATLVARGVPPSDVFAAVAREVALLLGVEAAHMGRFEPDGTATVVGAGGPAGWQLPVGTRVGLEGDSVAGLVARTGRSAWMHDYEHASGPVGALGRELGLRSAVGAPIVVDQRLWGVTIASTRRDQPLPDDAESRIAAFTELVATAISNTEARTQRGRLADEQAALRRVATIVAQGAPPEEVFRAATDEAGTLLGADLASMVRFESDDTLVIVAGWAATGEAFEAGARLPLTDTDLATTVLRTARPARTDHYDGRSPRLLAARERLGIRSSVGSPIVVEGQVWGLLVVHSRQTDPLAADTESRLTHFTELVAASISNVEARSELAASRARVVAAADAERRRVVRDLHDGAQQPLFRRSSA